MSIKEKSINSHKIEDSTSKEAISLNSLGDIEHIPTKETLSDDGSLSKNKNKKKVRFWMSSNHESNDDKILFVEEEKTERELIKETPKTILTYRKKRLYPNDILQISQWESFYILAYFDHSDQSDDESNKDSKKSHNKYEHRVITKENKNISENLEEQRCCEVVTRCLIF